MQRPAALIQNNHSDTKRFSSFLKISTNPVYSTQEESQEMMEKYKK